jgi:uncharacterized protein
MAILDRIMLFPIKSLDGVAVESATVLPSGALQHDREFALFDEKGQVVNAKRTAQIQQLRASFDLANRKIQIAVQKEPPTTFHLDEARSALADWFSAFFGFPIQIQQNTAVGFPDDLDSPGPTVISAATLDAVAQWFPGQTRATTRSRFRTNLELTDTVPFWEDRLFAGPDETVAFTIGDVQFHGVNPCQRCIVPTRDAITTEPTAQFQRTFITQRQLSLPDWGDRRRFNHFYRLAVNTRIPNPQVGQTLRVGDQVSV